MVRLLTSEDRVASTNRLAGIRLAVLSLRMRENWRLLFGGDDADVIALAIVAIVSERLLRTDVDPELRNLETPMPVQELSSCNINSIAAATDLNRETVRRKVDQLAKRGLLMKEYGTVKLAPGFTQQKLASEVVKSQLDELRRAINDLIRIGTVTVEH